jgi:hypothetical protein
LREFLSAVDWRAAVIALLVLFVIGFLLSFALASVVNRSQLQHAEFEVSGTLAPRVLAALQRTDLDAPVRGERLAELDERFQSAVLGGDILRIKVRDARGTIVYSNDHALIGTAAERR